MAASASHAAPLPVLGVVMTKTLSSPLTQWSTQSVHAPTQSQSALPLSLHALDAQSRTRGLPTQQEHSSDPATADGSATGASSGVLQMQPRCPFL